MAVAVIENDGQVLAGAAAGGLIGALIAGSGGMIILGVLGALMANRR